MLKKLVAIVSISTLTILIPITNIKAQEVVNPEKQALIQELLKLTKADKLSAQIMDSTLAQMEQELPNIVARSFSNSAGEKSAKLQQQQLEIAQRIMKRYRELLPQRINISKYIEDVSYSIYSKFFTEDELKDLVTFYRSTTGQKTIEVMPQMMTEINRQFSQKALPQVIDLMKEIVQEEMGKNGK